MRRFFLIILSCFCWGFLPNIYANNNFKMHEIEGMPHNPKIVLTIFRGELIPGLKSVTAKFKKLTGIDVEIAAVAQDRFPEWLKCQFLSEDPPAVIMDEGKGLSVTYGHAQQVVKLDDYLNAPNPFQKNNKSWKLDFSSSLINQSMDIQDGCYYCVPYTKFVVGFFYNKDKYKKYGLNPPKTWAQFIHNCQVIKNNGDTALITSLVYGDAQNIWWVPSLILKAFFIGLVPEINIEHKPGWKFDINDKKSIEGERISIAELIIAFKKGLIDPARSPRFREAVRLMKQFASTWRDDFMSVDGSRLYKYFAHGDTVHFMNGTWFIPVLDNLQKSFKKISPELAFQWGVFPFPKITKESTKFPVAAAIQNEGLRATLFVPKNKRAPWREKAGILFIQYLTAPEVAQKIMDKSLLYDISAITGVKPKPQVAPFTKMKEYAYLSCASMNGWDGLATNQYVANWQKFLSGQINIDQYLKRSSKSEWDSLMRRASDEYKRGKLNTELIKKELGEKELERILKYEN